MRVQVHHSFGRVKQCNAWHMIGVEGEEETIQLCDDDGEVVRLLCFVLLSYLL
jgi:hypothetical protein